MFLFFGFSIPCIGQQSIFDSLKLVGVDQSKWLKDLNKIIEAARTYRLHSRAHGESQGSYVGFTIPENCDSTEFGTYSIYEILPNKIVIQADLRFSNVPAFAKIPLLCPIDSNGGCGRKIAINEYGLDKIGELAYQYRIRPASDGGGGGSYIGYKIPSRYECTIFNRYAIRNIKPDEITIQAFKSTDGQIDASAIFDANGRRRMPFDYQVDLKKIESLAYQYRNLPSSQGGGGGSYIGFKIPHNLDSTEHGKFWLGDVFPDQLVIHIHPRSSSYNTLEVLDANGKEKLPDYRQRTDEDSFSKNHQAIFADMNIISKEAANYWKQSKPQERMRGSFEGFTIPISMAFTKNGRYSIAEERDDTLYVQAVSSIGSGTQYFRVDYTGRQMALISGQYYPPESALMNKRITNPLAMYKNADWKLNEVYQHLLVQRKSNTVFIGNLKNAERLWIQFRDAQLTEKYPQIKPASDKSMFTKTQLTYLTILTEDRIKELQDMFDQP